MDEALSHPDPGDPHLDPAFPDRLTVRGLRKEDKSGTSAASTTRMDDFVCPLAAESNKNLSRRLRLEGNDERLPRCELKPITEHQIVGNKGPVFKSPQSGN